jgi:hypothetical protein
VAARHLPHSSLRELRGGKNMEKMGIGRELRGGENMEKIGIGRVGITATINIILKLFPTVLKEGKKYDIMIRYNDTIQNLQRGKRA